MEMYPTLYKYSHLPPDHSLVQMGPFFVEGAAIRPGTNLHLITPLYDLPDAAAVEQKALSGDYGLSYDSEITCVSVGIIGDVGVPSQSAVTSWM